MSSYSNPSIYNPPYQTLDLPFATSAIKAEQNEGHPPSDSHMIPLTDLYEHFPDLTSFVHHPDFDHFAYCWMEFQYNIAMSQHVACRPRVKAWLVSMSAQLAMIVDKYPVDAAKEGDNEDNLEASTHHIKSAYKRLMHRFYVIHKVLDIIEQGRAEGLSPQEVTLPVYNQALQQALARRQQQSTVSMPSFMNQSLTSEVSPPSLSMLSLSSPVPPPPPPPTTSSFRSISCMQVMPYLDESCASSPHIHPLSLVLPPPVDPPARPMVSWSTPVTPSVTEKVSPTSWSCPVSPHGVEGFMTSFWYDDAIKSEEEEEEEEEEAITPLEFNTSKASSETEDVSSDYHQSQQDDDDEDDDEKRVVHHPESTSTVTTTRQRRRRRGPTTKPRPPHRSSSAKTRTATSYDNATTHYLMSMFFNIYSQRDKLTKDQRRQVVEYTGLNPRNVTYWFSNHKRRFQSALFLFKQLVAEGKIQTYDDYLQWRRAQGLSEDMVEAGDVKV